MKTNMIKVRTRPSSKTLTVQTLSTHGITLAQAYTNLSSGKGLVAKADDDIIIEGKRMICQLRHVIARAREIVENKPVYVAYCKEFIPARKKVVYFLEALIAQLASGSAPVYTKENFKAEEFTDTYTIRVPFEGRASAVCAHFSAGVRQLLDDIAEIPAKSDSSLVLALANLADIIYDSEKLLMCGYIYNGDIIRNVDATIMVNLAHQMSDTVDMLSHQYLKENKSV